MQLYNAQTKEMHLIFGKKHKRLNISRIFFSPNFFPTIKLKTLHGSQMSAKQHQRFASTCGVTGDTGKQFHSKSDFRALPMAVSEGISGLKNLITCLAEELRLWRSQRVTVA